MKETTVKYVVVGVGVAAVVAGVYNIATLPEMPETGNGLVGAVVRTVGEDYRQVLEWIATTSVLNSAVDVLVGVALILMGLNMGNE
jgi:hypothetical protein